MKTKKTWITLIVIIFVIVLAILLLKLSSGKITEETALCIANNSQLYTQLGCHACETQEKMFGKNYKYLNVIDCFYEIEKCGDIQYTPTWIINGKKYEGVQSIEKLKELTGCQ